MGGPKRPWIIKDSMNGRLVTFPNGSKWKLTKKISEKPWTGSHPSKRDDADEEDEPWQPSEAHAVYECVQTLTAAGCSVTPTLLAVQIAEQDQSVLEFRFPESTVQMWMPGGYIVYILMAKLPAQPMDINSFWNDYSRSERDQVRDAFKKSYMSVDHFLLWITLRLHSIREFMKYGLHHYDAKLENLMWDKENKKW
ncbi:MAG: hypothetical protein Q9170_005864 [Blastenia crenularia]